MSNFTYLGYFGEKKCCNSTTAGSRGQVGPQGTDGPRGAVGPTGPQGIVGPTGAWCTGSTGPGKTFIIDHPTDETKYLVHACLEGPEAGVYYRGKGEITNNESTTIVLPEYVADLAAELSIELTSVHSGKTNTQKNVYETSEIEGNTFNVYGKNGSFYWCVYGKKNDILVEPDKDEIKVNGTGPYKWYC